MIRVLTVLAAVAVNTAAAQRTVASLNEAWKFQELGAGGGGGAAQNCTDLDKRFPLDFDDKEVLGLQQVKGAKDLASCAAACCAEATCQVYQWGATGDAKGKGCWIGQLGGASGPCPGTGCPPHKGWQGRGRSGGASPSPPPGGGGSCNDPGCDPKTDDSGWRTVTVPHDFVVEHNFSEHMTGPKPTQHGYLPFGIAWYRKHFTPPASLADSATMWLDFDGIQTKSKVYLNGVFLGSWDYGYTGSRYFLNSSVLKLGEENVLAVHVDATEPDGWWYDGGGIYRNVWLTAIASPGPVIAPWGVYCGGSNVSGKISWDATGNPSGDGQLTPIIEIWNNATKSSDFSLALTIKDASGKAVGAAATGTGTIPAGGSLEWSPASPMLMPTANLWHVAKGIKPALYTLEARLSVGGKAADSVTETFGVRRTDWSNATGFSLNGKPFKILGNANHQDFAAVGVAVPDHLQWYRVQGQKNWGSNGWRTAHNPPTPALLDAMDQLGYVSWDENHRNGQLDQVPWLIKRDRNHPSVVIWSICNEVLCNSKDSVNDALAMKALMHKLDPMGNRPVSANQNGWVGAKTPLDVQGFDYSTQHYDSWHSATPGIPEISSETSSAVSDRGEYANIKPTGDGDSATGGYVTGYDTDAPGWGETAEKAWGGDGEPDGMGILTRPFISGGWTWTGWDYRGEPTPYAWPNKNSHFGIMDLMGFWKDRTHWYASWFPLFNEGPDYTPKPEEIHLHAFPHWNWEAEDKVDIWSFSNAAAVELFVNGKSLGKQTMKKFSHIVWKAVPFVAGHFKQVAYDEGGTAVATKQVNTTGVPASLRASIRDGVGESLYAGCNDMALVMVEVLDKEGNLCPDPDNSQSNPITLSVSGTSTAWVEGTGNGDPSSGVNNKSPMHPAYHGLMLGVIASGNQTGQITVTAASPGLPSATTQITVKAVDTTAEDFSEKWCWQGAKW